MAALLNATDIITLIAAILGGCGVVELLSNLFAWIMYKRFADKL